MTSLLPLHDSYSFKEHCCNNVSVNVELLNTFSLKPAKVSAAYMNSDWPLACLTRHKAKSCTVMSDFHRVHFHDNKSSVAIVVNCFKHLNWCSQLIVWVNVCLALPCSLLCMQRTMQRCLYAYAKLHLSLGICTIDKLLSLLIPPPDR